MNTVSEGNNRNYRLWSSVTMGRQRHQSDLFRRQQRHRPSGSAWAPRRHRSHDLLGRAVAAGPVRHDQGRRDHLADTVIPLLYQTLILLKDGSVLDILPSDAAPTGVTLTGGTVQENATAGTVVGTLGAVDPDSGDIHNFALTGGATNLFELAGNQICVKAGAALDFEAQSSQALTVKVTDQDGLSATQTVTIGVTNVMETGTAGNDVLTGGAGCDRLTGGEQ